MRTFLQTLADILFPPSPDARQVRETNYHTLLSHVSPYSHTGVTVLAHYRTPLIRAFLHEAKFRHNTDALDALGHLLGEHLNTTYPSDVCVVPIPLSDARLRERGYNQVAEIAATACAHAEHARTCTTLLRKVRHTPPQTSLLRAERLQNLSGAFAVNEHVLPVTTHLILLDDIVTTGTTLSEAAGALARAGFTHITRLALAH